MFDFFPVIRFSRSITLPLLVALVMCSGCQCLLPKRLATVPPPAPVIQPPTEVSEKYEAFRPIMPGQFIPSIPTPQTVPIREDEQQKVVPQHQPDIAAQSTIDELRLTIAELKMQLEEAKKAPPPVVSEPSQPLSEEKEVKPTRSLPIINNPGVHVYADESQNVRIEVGDKTLFTPGTWQVSAEGEKTLRTIAAEVRASDSASMLDIEGHTDSLMSDPNNPTQKHEIASTKTAAVMDFFVNALRWDATRIGTSSYGRSRPVADNGTPEGRARNNRIEIVVRGVGE